MYVESLLVIKLPEELPELIDKSLHSILSPSIHHLTI